MSERGIPRVPAKSSLSFSRVIANSALTSALADPAPALTKLVTGEAAAHSVSNCESFQVARILFGGTDAANEIFNYQCILWSRVMSSLNAETWVPRVIASGAATLGTDVYSATGTGLGAATSLFADTITDTIANDATQIFTPADNTRAILEIPLLNAERLEIHTDLNTAATADAFVQFGEATRGQED